MILERRLAVSRGLAGLAAMLLLPVCLGLGGCRRAPVPGVPAPGEGTQAASDNWTQFRGPAGNGVWSGAGHETTWSGKLGQGILWSSPELLGGKSSPVLWQDRVFVTGGDPERRVVYCLDANTGRVVWERVAGKSQAGDQEFATVGYAACSPATDGERVYAMFTDGTLAAYDMAGRAVWSRHFDLSENTYGHASSVVVHQGRLLLQLDQESEPKRRSVLLALDSSTGRTLWQTPRDVPSSWSTPVVVSTGEREELITCATPWVISYSPDSGAELWRAKCLGYEVVSSATMAGDLVVAASEGGCCAAIRPGGTGDVTRTRVVWKYEDDLPNVCSPVGDDRHVFMLSSTGDLTCLAADSGRREWFKALGDPCSASPILAGRKLYVLSDLGNLFVVDVVRGDVVGRGSVPEGCQATPAFGGEAVYVRGETHVYCLGRR